MDGILGGIGNFFSGLFGGAGGGIDDDDGWGGGKQGGLFGRIGAAQDSINGSKDGYQTASLYDDDGDGIGLS